MPIHYDISESNITSDRADCSFLISDCGISGGRA